MVLDVMLPGTNGFDVLRRIRARLRIPVLMLTAAATTSIGLSDSKSAPTIIAAETFNPANWLRVFARC